MGGIIDDEFDLTAVEWEVAWRYLGNHPAPVQIAYANTSFEGRIANVNSKPDMDLFIDAFRKRIDFDFWQTDNEHLTDEPPEGVGYEVLTADFESGADNTNITVAGPDDVLALTGTPKFMTASKFHGDMGARLAINQKLTWLLTNVSAFSNSVYVRIRANTEGGVGSHSFLQIEDINGNRTAELKVKPSGTIRLENGSDTLATSHGNVTYGTTDDDWFRVDFAASYDEVTGITYVQFSIALEPESNVYTDELSYAIEGEDRPYKFSLVTGGELTMDADTVRRANNASTLLGPVNPDLSLPTPELVFAGGSTAAGVYVKSVYDQVDAGLSVDLAVSLSDTMSSPTLVGAQTIAADRIATHTVSGLAANTRYYLQRVLPATGEYFGDQCSFVTGPPASGAWDRVIALVSCQDNGNDAPMAWQDIIDRGADAIFHTGDFGYVGQDIDATDSYSKDITKRVNAHRGNTTMRAAMQSASVDVVTISDHEIHINGDGWQGDSPNDAFGCLHSIRERDAFYRIQPVRAYLNPGVDRSYTFDYGSTVRVIVTDFRTPLRNNNGDTDDASKQMWGAAQEAAIFAALSTTKANIIVNETSWWQTVSSGAADKPASYPDAQQRLNDKINATGAYTGQHDYSTHTLWIGGDRHYLGYFDAADSDLGIPQIISSGMSKNSLSLQDGEVPTWVYNSGLRTLQSIQLKGGTTAFTLTYAGQTTATINAGDSASSVKTKLEALSNIAPGDVVVLADGRDEDKNDYDYQIRFGGTLNQNTTLLTATPPYDEDTSVGALVIKVQSPVCGWIEMTLDDDGAGTITVDCVARAVLDTSGPFSSWAIADVPGGTKTYDISP
jgi:hypothetical protein